MHIYKFKQDFIIKSGLDLKILPNRHITTKTKKYLSGTKEKEVCNGNGIQSRRKKKKKRTLWTMESTKGRETEKLR